MKIEDHMLEIPDNPTDKFVPLMKVKQPDYIWFCANPHADTPKLEKKSLAEISKIIATKSNKSFNWVEGLLIPVSMSDCQTQEEIDYTNWIDKVYIADTGELGFALFARVPIPIKTPLGLYGGQIVTQQLYTQKNVAYRTHAMITTPDDHDGAQFVTSTYYSGGILSFCQSAPERYYEECDLSYTMSALCMKSEQHGKMTIHRAVTTRPLKAGEIITWYYGDLFWENAPHAVNIDELLLTPYGEPVIVFKYAQHYHQHFTELKSNIATVLNEIAVQIKGLKTKLSAQELHMALSIYLMMHKGISEKIQTALINLPKEYLSLLSDQERVVTSHYQGIVDSIRSSNDPSNEKFFKTPNAFNNLQEPSGTEKMKSKATLVGKRASSFFGCAQYELALQLWQDAITYRSLWCNGQKIPSILHNKEPLNQNLHIATYLSNIAACYFRLERYQEAADTMSQVCALQKSMLPTQLFKSKTLADLEKTRDEYVAAVPGIK